MFRDSKDDELFNQALTLSLRLENEDNERFVVKSFLDLQDKLPSLSIPKTWLLWYPDGSTLIFMRPNSENCKIRVAVYLLVEFDLSIKAYRKGENVPISQFFLRDTRQLELILDEISSPLYSSTHTKDTVTDSSNASHIASAESHIQHIIDNIHDSISDDKLHDCPEVSRLQFIPCQLQNSLVPKNRRRYNKLTQILALKHI